MMRSSAKVESPPRRPLLQKVCQTPVPIETLYTAIEVIPAARTIAHKCACRLSMVLLTVDMLFQYVSIDDLFKHQ